MARSCGRNLALASQRQRQRLPGHLRLLQWILSLGWQQRAVGAGQNRCTNLSVAGDGHSSRNYHRPLRARSMQTVPPIPLNQNSRLQPREILLRAQHGCNHVFVSADLPEGDDKAIQPGTLSAADPCRLVPACPAGEEVLWPEPTRRSPTTPAGSPRLVRQVKELGS
jgi:hypothetical protein